MIHALIFILCIATSQANRGFRDEARLAIKKDVKLVPDLPSSSRHILSSEKNATGRATANTARTARDIRLHTAAMTARGAMVHLKNETKREMNPEESHLPGLSAFPLPEAISGTAGVAGVPLVEQLLPTLGLNDSQLNANADNSTSLSNKEVLMALAGGTGATIGGTGILHLDIDLVRRMRYQDKAVMVLLLFMYFVTLGFSASFAYRQAINNSPITFYADPRFHDLAVEGRDPDTFLANFSVAPKDVHLKVTGLVPVTPDVLGSIEWQGEYYHDAFSFALDLSQWVVRADSTDEAEADGEAGCPAAPALVNGVVAEDIESVRNYVTQDRNDLAVLEIQKEVVWPGWEELATNIKHKIRQQGFTGIISVHKTDCDTVSIYKNTSWANFLHSRTTKVLCALSILGWLIYLPYMWIRCCSTVVRARYKVDISIDAYWQLIADKLSSDGFVEDANAVRMNSRAGHLPQITYGQLTVYANPNVLRGDAVPPGEETDWQSVTAASARSED